MVTPQTALFVGGNGNAAPVPEKRTTGRMVACKRYSGEVFTCHAPLMAMIDRFPIFNGSFLPLK